jgi:hypothetical protein
MTTGLFESSATFEKCAAEKITFVALGFLDLVLTVLAMQLGLVEINPFIKVVLQLPLLMLLIKFFIPVFIAWLMPGKLLIPSIILLTFVIIWNIKELFVFLV